MLAKIDWLPMESLPRSGKFIVARVTQINEYPPAYQISTIWMFDGTPSRKSRTYLKDAIGWQEIPEGPSWMKISRV